uniref:Uncharacterized protein n=1 Tax=Ascaris lumbricoides TaxID=6252 RepID=A0A0M3HMV4_ASCLU
MRERAHRGNPEKTKRIANLLNCITSRNENKSTFTQTNDFDSRKHEACAGTDRNHFVGSHCFMTKW